MVIEIIYKARGVKSLIKNYYYTQAHMCHLYKICMHQHFIIFVMAIKWRY